MMDGFRANLKNQSIGITSKNGKACIHSCGQTSVSEEVWKVKYEQSDFIESMVEDALIVSDYMK